MKIVICDYKTDLARDLEYEKNLLKSALPNVEIVVYEYRDNKAELIDVLSNADAVINTYVTFDREVLYSRLLALWRRSGGTGHRGCCPRPGARSHGPPSDGGAPRP